MGLKKDYVITEIRASTDGSPYVFISLRSPEEVAGPQRPVAPQSVATFGSMDDMFKNLGSVISRQVMGSFATIIKLGLNEYEKLDINVGDRVYLNIDKMPIGPP